MRVGDLYSSIPLRTALPVAPPAGQSKPAAPSTPAAVDTFEPASTAKAKAGQHTTNLTVPFYTQMHVPDGYAHAACGPTSLAMVMAAEGKPPKSVLDVCHRAGTSKTTGTSNQGLVKAAQSYGFDPKVGHGWADLEKQLAHGHPAVVKVNTKALSNKPYGYQGPHMIVVTGLVRDAKGNVTSVICNDPGTSHPAKGKGIHYSVEDFAKAWGRYGDWSLTLH